MGAMASLGRNARIPLRRRYSAVSTSSCSGKDNRRTLCRQLWARCKPLRRRICLVYPPFLVFRTFPLCVSSFLCILCCRITKMADFFFFFFFLGGVCSICFRDHAPAVHSAARRRCQFFAMESLVHILDECQFAGEPGSSGRCWPKSLKQERFKQCR